MSVSQPTERSTGAAIKVVRGRPDPLIHRQPNDRNRRILVIPDTPAKVPSPNPQPPHALGSGDLAVIVTGAC